MTPTRSSALRRILESAAALVLASWLASCSSAPPPAGGPTGSSSSKGSSGGHGASPGQAKGWKPAAPDTEGPVVAVVGGEKITRHQIDSLITTAPASLQSQLREPDGYRQVIDRTVTQEAVYQAAVRDHIDRDSVYQGLLALTARNLLMRRYYELAVSRVPPVPDSTALAYYESHQADYTITARAKVRHILVATRLQAVAIRASLEGGALWDATCKAKSIDPATKDNGGLLGYLAPGDEIVPGVGKAPAIAAAAFSLPIGKISQPIQSPGGWNLLKVDERQPKTVQPFEDVKARIVAQLTGDAQDEFSKVLADSLRKYANATIFDDSIPIALARPKTADDLFKEAQSATTPTQRIDLYRALVKRYPDAHVSIQARFMIGFTYAEDLNEPDLARQEFQEFLREYPNSELAGSAKWMLENMDKPPPPMDDQDSTGTAPKSSPPPMPGGVKPGGVKSSP